MKACFYWWGVLFSGFALLVSSEPIKAATTNVIDGVVVDGGPEFLLGADAGFNLLCVTNGGTLTSIVSTVGRDSGADFNSALVSGPGSRWNSISNFVLGAGGSGNQVIV